MKDLKLWEEVLVYDRYRFGSKPLKARILSTAKDNSGVELLLLGSNSNSYPIGCVVWVCHQQLRNIKNKE